MKKGKRRHEFGVSPPHKRRADGITFDSKLERDRYLILKDKLKKGEISNLESAPDQPEFLITVSGKQICKYKADFRYRDSEGVEIVEDAKGMRTPIYRLKKKLVEAQYGITITEIEAKNLGQ